MIGDRAFAVFLVLAVATSASAQQVEWTDPSPHVTTFVMVQDDVRLEVLDWGGSGRPLVLLAGLGDTAHVFDDFGPMLATRYRVLGVTRRAHGCSSAPATGYTFTRLAEDVVRVLEAVGVKKPVIVGHSFAGEELHVLGARYSAQIAGLVYVDAAFNRADGSEDYDEVAGKLPGAPRPEPADLASFAALRTFLTRTQGRAGPEAHLRARYVANADGSVARPSVPDLPVRQAFSNEMQAMSVAYNPERIRVPALAIYAVPKSAGDLMRPWYDADDPVVRERVQTLYRLARERFARHAKWFEAFAERGRISELAGAHHLFISNARDVLEQIEAFMSSLPEKP
jgi:non-heme chloroperoxidase